MLQSLTVCQAAKAVYTSSGTAAISASEEQLNTELEKRKRKKKKTSSALFETLVCLRCVHLYTDTGKVFNEFG